MWCQLVAEGALDMVDDCIKMQIWFESSCQGYLFSENMLRIKLMGTSYYNALMWMPQSACDDKSTNDRPIKRSDCIFMYNHSVSY